jgi:hypothetical protein
MIQEEDLFPAEVFGRTASFNPKLTTGIRDAQSPIGAFSDVSRRFLLDCSGQ